MPSKPDQGSHYHNKGQEDASKDRYDPPNPRPLEVPFLNEKEIEERNDYNEGWRNVKDQKDKK